jgi:ABC-type bacteriocin/lantibiotic exporter with double-glycine peptidase domain
MNGSSSNIDKSAPTVIFKNVFFKYSADAPDVLRDFHLEIPAGGTCAIMGASGSGKSTILALLLGMLRPNSGSISLGGKSPNEFFSDPDLRLGFVGAEPYIIEGTIRDNLLYGVRDQSISDDELYSSLKRAQLGELVAGNPSFLDYVISESGEGLSTGQKQRLMFARALLARPNLLVLDEASANLDEKTEALLAAEIQRLGGKCTTIIITHRSGFVSWVEHRHHLTSSLEESRHV